MNNPPAVFTQDVNGDNTTNKSLESILVILGSYNMCETYSILFSRLSILFSRLVIKAITLSTSRETVKIVFSHHKNFTDPPGQIYFMIVLSACNTSALIGIHSAKVKELNISNFP